MLKPSAFFRKPPHHLSGDPDEMGWSLTLADMMTLLLCFFVLLLAVAQVDQEKYKAMSSVMAEAMGGDAAPSKAKQAELVREASPGAVTAKAQGKNLFELQLELAELVGEDREFVDLKMRADPHSVAISLGDQILFALGSAELMDRAKALLTRIAGPLSGTSYTLTIEGHTDDLPMHSAVFPSNWELSAARASAVARFLIEQGFPKDRVKIVGLADTQPLAPNDSEENRQKNRRVVILVVPE